MERLPPRPNGHSDPRPDADTTEYPQPTRAKIPCGTPIRGGKESCNAFDDTEVPVCDREDTCLGYTDCPDKEQEQSECPAPSRPSPPMACPMAPIPEETMETASQDGTSSSIYSQEDESSKAVHDKPKHASEGHEIEAPSNEGPKKRPAVEEAASVTSDDPAAEITTSQEGLEFPPSEDPSEALSLDRQAPGENIVVFINRKRAARIARHRAEKEASDVRDAMERKERERAASMPPPPGPAAPNPAKDFNPRPPGTVNSCSRGPAKFYTKAHVLTVHWSTMCPGLPAPVRQLKEVIRKYYGYEVTHCALPVHRDAPQVLAQALAEIVGMYGANAKDTLIILHYVGQSRTDADSFRICPPAFALCPAAVEVDLHALLCDTILTPDFNPDVLCLLDCAYALENRGRPCEGKEILAASTEPSRFTIRDRSVGGGFTRAIAAKLEGAMGGMQLYTDELEEKLAREAVPKTWSFLRLRGMFAGGYEDGKKRTVTLPRTTAEPGLRTGMGPPRRHVFLAPLVTPWQYWQMKNEPRRRVWFEIEDVEASCFVCGTLSTVGGLVHRHMCGRVPVRGVRGHTYDVTREGIEMDEVIQRVPRAHASSDTA